MKLLSEAFDTVKRVYAYEKSVKADTATLQKIMAGICNCHDSY